MTLWTPPVDSTNCWHLKSSSCGMFSLCVICNFKKTKTNKHQRAKQNVKKVLNGWRNKRNVVWHQKKVPPEEQEEECGMTCFFLFFCQNLQSLQCQNLQSLCWHSRKKTTTTYTWPSSWAMVKAALSPLSWTIEHELELSHMVPSSANPSVSHFCIWGFRQMFSLSNWRAVSRKCQQKKKFKNSYFQFVVQTWSAGGPCRDGKDWNRPCRWKRVATCRNCATFPMRICQADCPVSRAILCCCWTNRHRSKMTSSIQIPDLLEEAFERRRSEQDCPDWRPCKSTTPAVVK